MKFTYALTAACGFVGSAFSAPAPAPALLGETSPITDLAAVAPPGVSGALLADIAAPVGMLVTGLGLAGLAPGLMGLLISLSTGLKRDVQDLPAVEGMEPAFVGKVVDGVTGILEKVNPKGLAHAKNAEVEGMSPDVLGKLLDAIAGILAGLGLTDMFPSLPASDIATSAISTRALPLELDGVQGVSVGLLAGIAPSVAALVTALGLGTLAPGLVALLAVLSADL